MSTERTLLLCRRLSLISFGHNAVPEVPDLMLMDEEDVRVRLYAQGPLPASFLDGLGRAVSIRRSVSKEDVGTGGVADT